MKLVEVDVSKICPTMDNFSEGVYARTIAMPKGAIIVGKKHKTRHLNIIVQGSARVWIEGEVRIITAPYIFESKENCRKVLYIEEDMLWTTIHVTDETDTNIIEKQIISDEPLIGFNNIIKELECLGL